jgi:hypothetical protein
LAHIVTIEVVDTDASYGFFGKVVAKSDVRGMSDADIARESDDLLLMFPATVYSLRYVEEIPAA